MVRAATTAPNVGEHRVLRELGRRDVRTFAALRGPHELVVLRRFSKEGVPGGDPEATAVAAAQFADLARDARALVGSWHPNVERSKHVDETESSLTLAAEFIDGTTLEDLLDAATRRGAADRERFLPVPVMLRILVDVLGGLHALHGLRREGAPAGLIHGAVCPRNIVVGRDGVARVVSALSPELVRPAASAEACGYSAPELLDSGALPDARCDQYPLGVLLWEALTGRRLFPEADPARIASRQRTEELPAPELKATSPFAHLEDVAMRALSFEPALRFRSASEMSAEIRRIAGTRLAPGSIVAQTVHELSGERIRSRRNELDPSSTGTRRANRSQAPSAEDGDADIDATGLPPNRRPTPADRRYIHLPQKPALERVDLSTLTDAPRISPTSEAPAPDPDADGTPLPATIPTPPPPPRAARPASLPPRPKPKPMPPPPPLAASAEMLDDEDLLPGSIPSVVVASAQSAAAAPPVLPRPADRALQPEAWPDDKGTSDAADGELAAGGRAVAHRAKLRRIVLCTVAGAAVLVVLALVSSRARTLPAAATPSAERATPVRPLDSTSPPPVVVAPPQPEPLAMPSTPPPGPAASEPMRPAPRPVTTPRGAPGAPAARPPTKAAPSAKKPFEPSAI